MTYWFSQQIYYKKYLNLGGYYFSFFSSNYKKIDGHLIKIQELFLKYLVIYSKELINIEDNWEISVT